MSHDAPIYFLPPVFRGPSVMALPLAGEINYGMSLFKIDQLRAMTEGAGAKLLVVDTGIDDTHTDIAPNFEKSKDFTGSSVGPRDRNGHGTHASATAGCANRRIGVASRCRLYHGKGLGDNGSGGNSLIDAMEWGWSEGCKVGSFSWGGGGRNDTWERKMREWAEAGIWMFFSAGNSGAGGIEWPGASAHVFNVAAVDQNLVPASFTSRGKKLNGAGPGVNIISCKPGGGYQSMSGTSMSCPFVTGEFLLYRHYLEQTNQPVPTIYELQEMIADHAADIHTPGDDDYTGPGMIDAMLLAMNLTPDPFPVQ